MLINAIIGALIIGLCLSIFGSGGSILTIPVLLYLVGMQPELAIASSLLIVGIISLFNGSLLIRHRQVSWPHVLLFGFPGMAGTYLGAWLAIQVDSRVQLAVFTVLMLLSAILMWRSKPKPTQRPVQHLKLMLDGIVVGVVTGFVGVGGGFLIVPALVLMGGLPLSIAVGSSLLIISINAASGFYKYYSVMAAAGVQFDWQIIAIMAGGGIVGGLAGRYINQFINKDKLQKAFAIFLVMMAGVVLVKSVL